MKAPVALLMSISLILSACGRQTEEVRQEAHKVTVTTPRAKSVTITERYTCEIQSQRHISVRAVERGHLEAIAVTEGQVVQEGDVMFKVQSMLHQAKRDAEVAETKLAQVQLDQAHQQHENKL